MGGKHQHTIVVYFLPRDEPLPRPDFELLLPELPLRELLLLELLDPELLLPLDLLLTELEPDEEDLPRLPELVLPVLDLVPLFRVG